MKRLVLDAKWDGNPDYVVSDWEKKTGKAITGRVLEVGKGVTNVEVGDMVTVEEMRGCGHCTPCRNGIPSVIRLVAPGRLDLSPIITATFGLDNVVEAIAQSTAQSDGKIMVPPS